MKKMNKKNKNYYGNGGIINKNIDEWINSKDCYGNDLIKDCEKSFIKKRLIDLDDLIIVQGDVYNDLPNQVLIDISYLSSKKFQPNKKVIITLAHFIRPCLCSDCVHDNQYECYLNDCVCCSGDCT